MIEYMIKHLRSGIFPWVAYDRNGHEAAGKTKESAVAMFKLLYDTEIVDGLDYEEIKKAQGDML